MKYYRKETEAKKLIKAGGFITAIKVIRAANSLGLKESKDICEEWCKKMGLTPKLAVVAPTREAQLEATLQQFLDFLASLPPGWLGKTTGDRGLLNDAYIAARRLGLKVG